jgi:hypothetical protein
MDIGTEYEAFVDGHAADIGSLMFHHQDPPCPGGMRYRLRIGDPDVVRILKQDYGLGVRDKLDQVNASSVLSFVNVCISLKLVSAKRSKFAAGVAAWINTIQRMEVSPTEVVLHGECSPHVGS